MRRREFIRAVGGAAMFPLAARAQDPGRTYRLAVNLKAAKSLGLTFSESFLQRADNVIE